MESRTAAGGKRIWQRLPCARHGRGWTLLVGDDRLLHAGLRAGWDGSISGVAGCCPELLVAIVRSFRDGRPAETSRLQALLEELIAHLSVFPTPWGIQIALEARGLSTGPLPLPLSPTRLQQIAEFQTWFRAWILTSFPGIRDQGSGQELSVASSRTVCLIPESAWPPIP